MSAVLCDVSDGVAVITLNDPDRRNAVSLAINAELSAIMDDLEDRADIGAVVVTGTPPAFCAGADLGELGAAAEDQTGATLGRIYEGFLRIAHTPIPTLAAVNGAAVGAGMNMALACDVILAGESARFDTRFLGIGIHPGGGHTWRLANHADRHTVAAMVLFGEILDGAGAERHGLAWRCVPDADLLDTARSMAARAARAPQTLVRRTKATIANLDRVRDSEGAVEHEVHAQVWSMGQPDFQRLLATLQAQISGQGDRDASPPRQP